MRNLTSTNIQNGFTLTELMIAVALGMSVISSVLLGYMATYSGSVSTLANSKLNQEMTTLMTVMVEDIRRAGYNGTALPDPSTNVFAQVNNTALEVFNNMTLDNPQSPTGNGSCIIYSYDRDAPLGAGVVAATELFGFRRTAAGVVEMRVSGNLANPYTCGDTTGDWQPLTDPGFMNVTNLNFNLFSSVCLNAGEPDGAEDGGDAATMDDDPEFDCYVTNPDPTNITVETREILITLTANLTDDAFVQMTKTQIVRVRNELIRIR